MYTSRVYKHDPPVSVYKLHGYELRNPVIARIFLEMNLIEQWGTGIPEVFAALAERGLPAPLTDAGREFLSRSGVIHR